MPSSRQGAKSFFKKQSARAAAKKRQRVEEEEYEGEVARSAQSPRFQRDVRAHIYNKIAGCNRSQVARKCGVSASCISKIVTGERSPSLAVAESMATELEMKVGDISDYAIWIKSRPDLAAKTRRPQGRKCSVK